MPSAAKPVTKPTDLWRVEQSVIQGTTVPVERLPIPEKTKALMVGKDAMTILREAAPFCANYLFNCLISKRFKPSWSRIDVAKYVLDQVCGKARVRLEVSGADGTPLNWQSVMLLFAQADKAEELARHGKPLPPLPSGPELASQNKPTDTEEVQAPGETEAPQLDKDINHANIISTC